MNDVRTAIQVQHTANIYTNQALGRRRWNRGRSHILHPIMSFPQIVAGANIYEFGIVNANYSACDWPHELFPVFSGLRFLAIEHGSLLMAFWNCLSKIFLGASTFYDSKVIYSHPLRQVPISLCFLARVFKFH